MFNTYYGESPDKIRSGDRVVDARDRIFTAAGTPELVLGDWHVNGYDPLGEFRSFTLDAGSSVTISYEEEDE